MPKGYKGRLIDYCGCCSNEIQGHGKGHMPQWCEECLDHLDGKTPGWQESWYALYFEECPNAIT